MNFSSTGATFASLVGSIIGLIDLIIPILVGMAVLLFFWGLIQYVRKAGEAKGREAGKQAIIWGLIGLFIIFSLGGILNIISYSLNIPTPVQGTPILPSPNV